MGILKEYLKRKKYMLSELKSWHDSADLMEDIKDWEEGLRSYEEKKDYEFIQLYKERIEYLKDPEFLKYVKRQKFLNNLNKIKQCK